MRGAKTKSEEVKTQDEEGRVSDIAVNGEAQEAMIE